MSRSGGRVTATGWKLNFINKFGRNGQMSALKRFYQCKYQIEEIKQHPDVHRELRKFRRKVKSGEITGVGVDGSLAKGRLPEQILCYAENLRDLNAQDKNHPNGCCPGEARALNTLPTLNQDNRTAKLYDWSEKRIFQERVGRVARLMKHVAQIRRNKSQIWSTIQGVSSGEDTDEDELTDTTEGSSNSSAWAEGSIISVACSDDMGEWHAFGMSYQVCSSCTSCCQISAVTTNHTLKC